MKKVCKRFLKNGLSPEQMTEMTKVPVKYVETFTK